MLHAEYDRMLKDTTQGSLAIYMHVEAVATKIKHLLNNKINAANNSQCMLLTAFSLLWLLCF